MLEMKTIHPHKDETYRIAFDDKCLVVSSGSKEDAPKTWISKSMVEWIKAHSKEIFKEQTVNIEFGEGKKCGICETRMFFWTCPECNKKYWLCSNCGMTLRKEDEEKIKAELAEGQGKDYSSTGGVEGQKEQ